MEPDRKQRNDLNRGGVIDAGIEVIFVAVRLVGRVIRSILN